jgi:hypothetical protein
MSRGHRTFVAALVVCAALAVTAWAPAQAPVSVPPALRLLEQKMAQIRFNTARVSARFVLGELGPAGAELGTGVKGTNGGFVTSTVGVIRLSPREASVTSKAEALGLHPGERTPVAGTPSTERVIGDTIYTYKPSVQSYDGGRPWVQRKLPSPKPGSESAGFPGLSDSLTPTLTGADARRSAAAPFAKLIKDLNDALSVQETGPMTIDGQQVTGFIASVSLAKLLSPKQLAAFTKASTSLGDLLSPTSSPKQREEVKKHNEEVARKLSEARMELDMFIAPSGLPVRTIVILGNRTGGIGGENDILALEVPLAVHAPPPRKTITEAQLRKLESKRAQRVCSIIPVHIAPNTKRVICPKR